MTDLPSSTRTPRRLSAACRQHFAATNEEQNLECPICLEFFDHTDRRPLSLHCGHSFCRLCIDRIAQLDSEPIYSIICPTCRNRQAYFYSEGTLNIPTNFGILEAIDQMKATQKNLLSSTSLIMDLKAQMNEFKAKLEKVSSELEKMKMNEVSEEPMEMQDLTREKCNDISESIASSIGPIINISFANGTVIIELDTVHCPNTTAFFVRMLRERNVEMKIGPKANVRGHSFRVNQAFDFNESGDKSWKNQPNQWGLKHTSTTPNKSSFLLTSNSHRGKFIGIVTQGREILVNGTGAFRDISVVE